jgi:hypothetical protein
MQSKLKYKLFGEFSDYEINELVDWFKQELGVNISDAKTIKITIDWEPAGDGVI